MDIPPVYKRQRYGTTDKKTDAPTRRPAVRQHAAQGIRAKKYAAAGRNGTPDVA